MKATLEKKTVILFSLAALSMILILILIIFFYNSQKLKSSNNWIEHTQEVLRMNDKVLLDVLNIETGARGYFLTGDDTYLAPFDDATKIVTNDLNSLTQLTSDNLMQQARIDSLKNVAKKRLLVINKLIEEKKVNKLLENEKLKGVEKGKILTDQIRKIISDINIEEFRLLKERKKINEKSNSTAELIFICLLLVIVVVFVLIVVNIQNQKTKNMLAEKEKIVSQYSRSLIETSLDPLVTISLEGKILDVNNASVNVTGIPRVKLIGTDFSNYFTEPEKANEGYRMAFKNSFVSDYPLTLKHVNGSEIDVVYNASVYRDAEGKVLGLFAAARDITNRKKAEEQLIVVNKELEAFTYSVSHDLRAPLRAINGYAKILQEDYSTALDDAGMGSLNAILKNSKKMGELIDDLLAFSRLGRKVVATTEINMKGLVHSVKEDELIDSEAKIEFEIKELIPAKGQQALIKQVVVNLISNAVKYSRHKSISKIEIGSYYKDNMVVYYVKDNGAGFDMQYYAKLFGVFQRLHSSEEFEGTGIGLAIVQKIIHRHNGTVWAESIVNEGSTFYFTLPTINS